MIDICFEEYIFVYINIKMGFVDEFKVQSSQTYNDYEWKEVARRSTSQMKILTIWMRSANIFPKYFRMK